MIAATFESGRVAAAVREILYAIGEDATRAGLRETPRRVGNVYQELCAGVGLVPVTALRHRSADGQSEMVLMREIPFYSRCEHHLLPFPGFPQRGLP